MTDLDSQDLYPDYRIVIKTHKIAGYDIIADNHAVNHMINSQTTFWIRIHVAFSNYFSEVRDM